MDSSRQDARIVALEQRLESLERRCRLSARRVRRATAIALVAVVGGCVWTSSPEARAQFGLTLASLNSRLQVVEAKTAPISVDGSGFTITGKNVFIQDGSGGTNGGTGLGNLTIGYNAQSDGGDLSRTGTHNLILGDQNTYTSYGGLVAGNFNYIYSPYASISGGSGNYASGNSASVSGGAGNYATGDFASVSGGLGNAASAPYSSVSGGAFNLANGYYASVSGGLRRYAGFLWNWAAGGLFQDR
jgi:hypothetical protein